MWRFKYVRPHKIPITHSVGSPGYSYFIIFNDLAMYLININDHR